MDDRYFTARAETYSSGTPGRALAQVRTNHFVADDPALPAYGGRARPRTPRSSSSPASPSAPS